MVDGVRFNLIVNYVSTCLAQTRETRRRVHGKHLATILTHIFLVQCRNSAEGARQTFSDRVGRDGISGFIGEVELHRHNGPEI